MGAVCPEDDGLRLARRLSPGSEDRDRALELCLYLPSGRDTGYSGLYAVEGNEVLIAYYSGHEYPDADERITHGPCDIYLASVSL